MTSIGSQDPANAASGGLSARSFSASNYAAYEAHIASLVGSARRLRLGDGAFSYRLQGIQARSVDLTRRLMAGGGSIEFPSSGDNYIFGVINRPLGHVTLNDWQWPADRLAVSPPHQPYSVVLPDQCDIITVSVRRPVVAEFFRLVHRQDIQEALGRQQALLQPNGRQVQLAALLQRTLAEQGARPGGDLGPTALRMLEETLMFRTLEAYAPPGERPSLTYRGRLARRARDYLNANPAYRVSISDLCREMGAAERTLHLGFQELFGMSPIRYLRFLRLNGARQALTAGDPGMSVTEVATAWGFFHFGRFAEQYRKAFGEPPSETRRMALGRQAHAVRWPLAAGTRRARDLLR